MHGDAALPDVEAQVGREPLLEHALQRGLERVAGQRVEVAAVEHEDDARRGDDLRGRHVALVRVVHEVQRARGEPDQPAELVAVGLERAVARQGQHLG